MTTSRSKEGYGLNDQCEQQLGTLDRITDLLEAVLSIDLADLERIVQEAVKDPIRTGERGRHG